MAKYRKNYKNNDGERSASFSKTDSYGTHYPVKAWQKRDKNNQIYYEGFATLQDGTCAKVKWNPNWLVKKGEKPFKNSDYVAPETYEPLELTFFVPEKYDTVK